MLSKIDVVVNNLNRPYTLLLHLIKVHDTIGKYINTYHLFDESRDPLVGKFVEIFKQKSGMNIDLIKEDFVGGDICGIYSERGQHLGWHQMFRKCTTPYLLTMHSDVIMFKDPIPRLSDEFNKNNPIFQAGVFGQCWKCPNEKSCIVGRRDYDGLIHSLPITNECRTNEWFSLINKDKILNYIDNRKELYSIQRDKVNPWYPPIFFDFDCYITNLAYREKEVFINCNWLENYHIHASYADSSHRHLLHSGDMRIGLYDHGDDYYVHIIGSNIRIGKKDVDIETFIRQYIIDQYGLEYMEEFEK